MLVYMYYMYNIYIHACVQTHVCMLLFWFCHRIVFIHSVSHFILELSVDTCALIVWARFRLRHYQNVFTGAELCDWLIGAGLAGDKGEAVAYGRRLLLGGVIAHVTGVHHFQHSPFFYRFVDAEDADC